MPGALALAILFGLTVVACNSGSQTAAPQAQTFTTFDAPGAGTGIRQGTVAIGGDDTVGIYWDASGVAHGFVRTAAGTIGTFDAPGVGTGKDQGTFPFSIDSAGNIAGTYTAGCSGCFAFDGSYHGFVRSAAGTITTFDVPGAACGGTVPISINSGVIAGMYWDANCVYHGFVRAANGTITTFSAPGAGTSNSLGTAAIAVNSAGVVTGTYSDASNGFHGFVRAANGTITTFSAPGAGTGGVGPFSNSVFLGTAGLSIDTAGDVAGAYTDASMVAHGFVRAASGAITTFDVPGAGKGMIQGTLGLGINDAGNITGGYVDGSAVAHGFVRAANGTITTFDAPGAGTGGGQGTLGLSINAAGVVTGAYMDARNVAHCFVLTP